ncbi:Kelch-like protein 10, partial [Tyrophagus putrescentiae]
LWFIDPTFIHEFNDFEKILQILSSGKLKNDTVWQVMHDWINVDISNRLTYFNRLFKNCFQFDNIPLEFVENNIFSSDIFKLLPLKFQNELRIFCKEVLQQRFKQLLVCIESSNHGSVKFYDPKPKKWRLSLVQLLLQKNQQDFQFALLGNMLYSICGSSFNVDYPFDQIWSRDLSDPSSQWTSRANMNQRRKWFSSVVLNDSIYALGGVDKNNHSLRSCERYDSQMNEWFLVAWMNRNFLYASAAVLNGCIYIAGGRGEKSNKNFVRSVEKYDPQSNRWSEVAPMTTARGWFSLTPFAGRLWATGGFRPYQLLSSVESYDPVTDTWREEAPLKQGRRNHSAIEFNEEFKRMYYCREICANYWMGRRQYYSLVPSQLVDHTTCLLIFFHNRLKLETKAPMKKEDMDMQQSNSMGNCMSSVVLEVVMLLRNTFQLKDGLRTVNFNKNALIFNCWSYHPPVRPSSQLINLNQEVKK